MPGYSVRAKDGGAGFLELGMLCVFCHYLLRRPRQIAECGHLYCDECLKDVINTTQKCAVRECQAEVNSLDETFEDRATLRDIMRLPVLCYSERCDWEGTLKELEEKHFPQCPHCSVTCTFDNCTESFDGKEQLAEHQLACSHRVMPCKFSYVGCPENGTRRQLIEHCKEKVSEHLHLFFTYISKMRGGAIHFDLSSAAQLMERVNQEVLTLESGQQPSSAGARSKRGNGAQGSGGGASSSKASQSLMITHLDRLQGKVQRLKNRVDTLETRGKKLAGVRNFDEMLSKTQRLVTQLETQLLLRDQALHERARTLELKEKATYNGILLWKIDSFSRRRREAREGHVTSIYSHYFYTSTYGYRLRARIYLNGDGAGRGTHISLFFVVCRGEFDGHLKWPFSMKVVISIVDQTGDMTVRDAFVPNVGSASYQKPTTPMNVASGIPDFMPLTLLDDQGQGYVKDDCMFVRVVVIDN